MAHRAVTLGALSASYVLRRPLSLLYGLPAALRVPLVPPVAAWTTLRAASGALEAVRIGVRARRAPVLQRSMAPLAAVSELAPACTLIADPHLVVPGQVPVELAHDPAGSCASSTGTWPGTTRCGSAISVHAGASSETAASGAIERCSTGARLARTPMRTASSAPDAARNVVHAATGGTSGTRSAAGRP